MKRTLLLSLLFIVTPLFSLSAAKSGRQGGVTLSSGKIIPQMFSLKSSQWTPGGDVPYFEFVVNSEKLSSQMPVWRKGGVTQKTLSNGGTVTTYTFKATGAFRGLYVLIDRETFPSCAFVRERLRLHADRPGFKLTNVDGRNHFVFPQYCFHVSSAVTCEEIRMGRFESKTRLGLNHMFHPDRFPINISEGKTSLKGPFVVLSDSGHKLFTAYEHASQDNTFMNEKNAEITHGNDAHQGVEGDVAPLTDDDLWFIATEVSSPRKDKLLISNYIRRGGYIDGEEIPVDGFYESVWSAVSLVGPGESLETAMQDYVYCKITDHKASRTPTFYYNTWGMQRDQPSKMLRDCLTEERLFRDIEYCREMGIQRFILDDGWQSAMGYWTANEKRLPGGLGPVIKRINDAGMEAGVWLSLLALDKNSDLYAQHPEWHISDKYGAALLVQWHAPGMDLVSTYYDTLLEALKKLVDQGVRFFKWDAVSTMSSANAGLYHGDENASPKERMDRYNYLFPFYVTSLARELKEYNPDVVVELDLTEHWRCMIGLMTLQEAKYFWINNGSSKYGDYTTFRTKSVRETVNEFAGILPPEVFTYATYPINLSGALKYNVATAIQAGHGFWGNLDKTTPEDRKYIAGELRKASMVLPYVQGKPLEKSGEFCGSPELYVQADRQNGYALMTGFSAHPYSSEDYVINVNPDKVTCVLGSAFGIVPSGVRVPLNFVTEDDCCSVFVIGGAHSSVRVVASSAALEDCTQTDGGLYLTARDKAVVKVYFPSTGRSEEVEVTSEGKLIK